MLAAMRLCAAPLLVCATIPLAACNRKTSSASGATSARGSVDVARADSDLQRAMADSTEWPSYGRDFSNQRFSPLTQINTGNVGQLAPAWVYHTGIVSGFETSPVVVGGVMYISTPLNHVVALDAATGAKKWEYTHDYRTTTDCCGPINRGVTVYGGRVYMGTVDARLVALDAATGRKLWDVQVGDNEKGYHITSAPLAIDGKIITGISCGEQGGRCYVTAYDASSGKQIWRFYTIPSPADGGWWGKWRATDAWGLSFGRDIAKEKADSAKYPDSWKRGGAPMWHVPLVDTKLGLVYLNVGNAAPDLDDSERPGDNLYSDCMVALDLKTGKLRWYFQAVSHDRWDYDLASPLVMLDLKDSTGAMVPVLAEAGKTGFVYVVDRRNGKPIRRSDAFVPHENFMKSPTDSGIMIQPATLGGSDWSPPAYSPQTGYLYVDGNYIPMLYKLHHEQLQQPAQYWGGAVLVPTTGNYGLFTAVDLSTGRIAWQERTAKPLISGAVATAGGLVFTGLTDQKFAAYDARSGAQLWHYDTKAGVNAPPITYMINGRQYVAVASGGNLPLDSIRGDELLVFALPTTAGSQGAASATKSGSTTGTTGTTGTTRAAPR
jgi:alcohol dehydrogenase (cytochrome c)